MTKRKFSRYPRLFFFSALVLASALQAAETNAAKEPDSARIDEALARSVVDRVVRDVERLRGLTFNERVPVSVVDDDQALAQTMQRLEDFGELEAIRYDEMVMKHLGMAEADDDVLELFKDALREQIGGYYDPKVARFYLLDDMPAAMVDILTAHELTHALEDQHFNLDALLVDEDANDDEIFARGSVTEGSATLLMTIFSIEQTLNESLAEEDVMALAGVGQEAIDRLPKALLRQMMAPYIVGMSFVQRGNAVGWMGSGFPVDDVNRVYENPPTSSEQILHPEKYWDQDKRDDPIEVSLGAAGNGLGDGWAKMDDGVLGELNVAMLVGAPTPDPDDPAGLIGDSWTNAAAAGWGGDRYELWVRGKKSVVLLSTTWDSKLDAQQFTAALGDGVSTRSRSVGRNVALVYGKAARKKLDSVLGEMLQEAPQP
jgi:hypothetical protein